jgi:nucleoside-diphosphate-sugar epimerase
MDYGIKKRQCEDILWRAHDEKLFPISMLRPTYVSGPHDPTKRDFFWIERILDGKPLLVPGCGDFAFQSVFVDDVTQAFVELLNFDTTIGHAYNVVGEEIFSLNDYLKSLSRLLHRTPQLVHIDQEVFDRLPFSHCPDGDVFPFNTRRTAIFSLDKIKRDLNYRSTLFHKWMSVTIDWYLNKYQGHSYGYERRTDEIKFIGRWKNIQSKLGKEIFFD